MKDIVDNVKFPETNVYYEHDSADGFAFLGCARAKVGLDWAACYEAVDSRDFCLNAEQSINKITVPFYNQYVYTLWACIEFLDLINKGEIIGELVRRVDDIGQYPNKMMRYCSTEVEVVVPNVTSAAALIYSMVGKKDKSKELVQVLREQQVDGNWRYYNLRTNKYTRVEDSYHVAMMVYHLKKLQRISGINTEDIVLNSIKCLNKLNAKKLKLGSIGWGIPMLSVATKGIDAKLYNRSFNKTLTESIKSENFRVRAISAWALTK